MVRIERLLAAAILAASLSSCMGGPASLGGEPPLTPTSRYSLQVEPGLDRIALAVHEGGLSANQQRALDQLVARYAAAGGPALVIEAPGGGDEAAVRTTWDVKAAVQAFGVPGERIQVISYAAPDPRAPVLIGFETLQASVPRCGTAWGGLSRTGDNMSASNFGCAVNANLAAQIADPRDIVAPRAMTPADAGRRTVVFQNYRAGEQTAAPQEQLIERSRVSTAVE